MQSSYPLAERDPNISGRTSRASNLSTGSKHGSHHNSNTFQNGNIYRKHHAPPSILPAAPGVMGMLRTTMEIGDVGSLPFSNRKFGKPIHQNGLHNVPHAAPQRRSGTASRQSNGSMSSQHQGRSSRHQAYPSVSSAGRRRSMTSNITAPPFLDHSRQSNFSIRPETPLVIPESHNYPEVRDGGRSLSLTNTSAPAFGFTHNRSLTSLRSRVEPYKRAPSPGYRYPTRLKRPGFRPSSPALGDLTGIYPSKFTQQAGSRLKPPPLPAHPYSQSTVPVLRHPAPYLASRNRSAPAVTTLHSSGSNQAFQSRGAPSLSRDDTGSLTDRSINQSIYQHTHHSKHSINHRPSLSIRTNSRSSTNHNVPSPAIPPSTPSPPHTARIFSSVAPNQNNVFLEPAEDAVTASAYLHRIEDDNSNLEKEVTDVFNETMSDTSPMPPGFVQRIRAILEQNERSLLSSDTSKSSIRGISLVDGIPIPNIPELEGAPVGRRITREMIMQALCPSVEDLEPSTTIEEAANSPALGTLPNADISRKELKSPLQDYDRISLQSVSQSVYSRPTNYTDTIDPLAKPVDEPPVPPMPSFGTPNHTRKSELRKSISLGSGMSSDTVQRSSSTVSGHHSSQLSAVAVDATAQAILDRVKRRWSVRPSSTPIISPTTDAQTQLVLEVESTKLSVMPTKQEVAKEEAKNIELPGILPKDDSTPALGARQSLDPPKHIADGVVDLFKSGVPITSVIPETHVDNSAKSFNPYSVLIGNESNNLSQNEAGVNSKKPSAWMGQKQSFETTFGGSLSQESGAREIRTQDIIPENTKVERFNIHRAAHALLPDVKEEPGLESNTDLRSTASTYYFAASRISGPRSIQSKADRNSRDCESIAPSAKTHSVFKQAHSQLAEAHAIPSLNFSSANLLSKLNEALGEAELPELSVFESPQPVRLNSSQLREKCRTLFLSLDDMVSKHEELAEFASTSRLEILEQLAELDHADLDDDDVFDKDVEDHIPTFRPLSPSELVDEVNRLSVPSVTGLAYRLSEIFPSLKRHFCENPNQADMVKVSNEDLDPVAATIQEIRSLGHIDDEEQDIISVPSQRVSIATARLKPLSAHFHTEEEKLPALEKVTSNKEQHRHSEPCSRSDGLTGMAVPAPAGSRMRSFSDSDVDSSIIDRMNRLSRLSHRSLQALGTPDSCPWNLSSSYPWSNSIPLMDIKFPRIPSPHHRTSGPSLSQRQLVPVSESICSFDENRSDDSDGLHAQEVAEVVVVSTTAGKVPAPPATTKHRAVKKHGLFGSLSRRLLGPIPAAAASPAPPIPPLPLLAPVKATPKPFKSAHARNGSTGVNDSTTLAGSIPVTNLPSSTMVLNVDDVHSFFSDDSSTTARRGFRAGEGRRRTHSSSPPKSGRRTLGRSKGTHQGSLRKRLTVGLRPVGHPAAITIATAEARRQKNSLEIGESNLRPTDTAYVPHPAKVDRPTAMTQNEVRAKRLVDRIKVLLWRSSELLRAVSGRRKHAKVGVEEGWSDNGESFADLAVGSLEQIGAPTVRGTGTSSRTTSMLTSP